MVLKLECTSESRGGLVKTQMGRPHSQSFDSVGIFNEFLGDADAGPMNTWRTIGIAHAGPMNTWRTTDVVQSLFLFHFANEEIDTQRKVTSSLQTG